MKNILMAIMLICAVTNTTDAKMVEYFEDAYLQQAPQELVAQVEQIAQIVGLDKDYQVVIPKKPGLQINPWNKLVGFGINPQNKNPFIIINPEWFSTLPKDQQTFLIARNVIFASQGVSSLPMKLLPWIWSIGMIALMVLCFLALRRTRFATKPLWMRILAVYAVFAIANLAFLTALYIKINTALSRKYDSHITQLTLEKIGQDKQVAISAFQTMGDFVKKELAEGDTFWKSHENTFSDLIQRLK